MTEARLSAPAYDAREHSTRPEMCPLFESPPELPDPNGDDT